MANTLYEYYTAQGKPLPTIQERGQLYGQYGLGDAASYAGTPEQNTALLGMLSAQPAPAPTQPPMIHSTPGALYGTTQTPTVVSNQNLGAGSLVMPPQQPANIDSDIQSALALVKAMQSTQDQILKDQQTQYENELKASLDQVRGLPQKAQNLETQYQIPQQTEELRRVMSDLAVRSGALEAGIQKVEGRAIPMELITGEQEQLRRNGLIEINTLAARAQALQGNIELSRKLVDRAIDLEFKPLETQINGTLKFIELNRDKMNAEEKKQAAALEIVLNQQKERLEKDKAVRSEYAKMQNQYLDVQIPPYDTTKSAEENMAIARRIASGSKKFNTETSTDRAINRDESVSNFLETGRGTDGFVSATTYQEALRKYIANGGTRANFFASYPQQAYMRELEIEKLPAALRPQLVVEKSKLTEAQQSIIGDAKSALDRAKQQYQDADSVRASIIKRSIDLYGFDPSPYL